MPLRHLFLFPLELNLSTVKPVFFFFFFLTIIFSGFTLYQTRRRNSSEIKVCVCVCVSKNWTRAWVPGFIFSSAFASWVMGYNSVHPTAPQRVEPEHLSFPSSSRKVKKAFFEVLFEFPSILLHFLWTCCQIYRQQVWSWFKVHLRGRWLGLLQQLTAFWIVRG